MYFLTDSTEQDWIYNRKATAPERYVFIVLKSVIKKAQSQVLHYRYFVAVNLFIKILFETDVTNSPSVTTKGNTPRRQAMPKCSNLTHEITNRRLSCTGKMNCPLRNNCSVNINQARLNQTKPGHPSPLLPLPNTPGCWHLG